jgi:hypothetical protein
MPKPSTFPILIDELKNIGIPFLTKHGYLIPNRWKHGTINWERNGNKTGSISIEVNTESEAPHIWLKYKCNETPINCRVQLVSVPSNLGKGLVWYFICPLTGKRCRKLYLANTYFYNRLAFDGAMYQKQTQSKKSRYIGKTLGAYFQSEQLFELIYKKHFKKHYAGKPTKQYLKLTQQIQKAESITASEIERALLS